jgi:hypothetical protein
MNHIEKRIEKLKSNEFMNLGPIIILAPERKFMQKYMTREEYHDWIDGELRTYH